MDQKKRDRAVLRILLVEGLANLGVLGLKLAVGLSVNSLAILADALHSLTDVANNLVALLIIRVSSKPADRNHPYGHRKFETLAVFILAMLLVLLAFELITGALAADHQTVESSPWALALMGTVLAINMGLAAWQRHWALRLDSDILRADAAHTFSDALTTLGVIAGWQLAAAGWLWADMLSAFIVAAMVLYLAYQLFRRSAPVLLDAQSVDAADVHHAVARLTGVQSVGRIRSRWIGPVKAVDIVIEVAPGLSVEASHAIADRVEQVLEQGFQVTDVSVHVEPHQRAR